MTSKDVKELLIRRFTFFNGYVGAIYEAPNLNSADVIAVRHGGKVQEYEIKVSKADLIGEMRCARVAKGLVNIEEYMRKNVMLNLDTDGVQRTPEQIEAIRRSGHTLSKTKLKKHRAYLTPEGREIPSIFPGFPPFKPFVPNTFYWCIPYELLETCRELNRGLPYGIYVFDMPQRNSYERKYIVTPPRSLGGQGDAYFELFNRACTHWSDAREEIDVLRRKLTELEQKLTIGGADAANT
jgi:hypothetical protein